jgi:hypothetical protein
MTTLEIIEKCAYTGAILFAFFMLVYLLIIFLSGKSKHNETLSDSRILLDYHISEIFIMDDDIIITYSQPL